MSTEDPRGMRPATAEAQRGNEDAHGEHEWLMLGTFRSQCHGFVGRAGVPAVDPALPAKEPVDWGEWTPGKGWERAKAELGDMVPDITEEDERLVDTLLSEGALKAAGAALATARVSTCGHCGAGDVGTTAAGYSSADGRDLCHPNAAGRPDCYRLVTIYHHDMDCVPCRQGLHGAASDFRRHHVTTPDQPMQGSTADYCSAFPGERHHLVTRVRRNALVSVTRCSLCGWIDFDDLREQAEALIADGRAEGRRQATDGWKREFGAQYRDDSWVQATFDSEAEAVEFAAGAIGHRAVSRLVGPWEPAEPEHRFDPTSVRDPAVTPYSMFEESDDPYCICGGGWDSQTGCTTQQPGWKPPPPYDGPSLEELLPPAVD